MCYISLGNKSLHSIWYERFAYLVLISDMVVLFSKVILCMIFIQKSIRNKIKIYVLFLYAFIYFPEAL